jgi:hypothetical protein
VVGRKEAGTALYGVEPCHAPSGLGVVPVGDVVDIEMINAERRAEKLADGALAGADRPDEHNFGTRHGAKYSDLRATASTDLSARPGAIPSWRPSDRS